MAIGLSFWYLIWFSEPIGVNPAFRIRNNLSTIECGPKTKCEKASKPD